MIVSKNIRFLKNRRWISLHLPNLPAGKPQGAVNNQIASKPLSQLDYEIIRIALKDAYKLIANGVPPDEAAKRATPGAWSPYRQEVEFALQVVESAFQEVESALNNFPQTRAI